MKNVFTIKGVPVKQIEGAPNYAVSEDARVFRIKTEREMAQYPAGKEGNEYLVFRTSHNNNTSYYRVHRAVMECWGPINDDPENKTQVNHKDSNTFNNCLTNLEWVTPAQNQVHASVEGNRGMGGKLYNSSMTVHVAHLACQDLQSGMRVKDVANKYDVPVDNIRKLKAGDTYFKVRCLYNIDHEYKTNLSEATVRWVCERINEGYADKTISEMSHNQSVLKIEVKRIRYKIRYQTISNEYF